MHWRLIVDTTHNVADFNKQQIVRTTCSMLKINGFLDDWSYIHRIKPVSIIGDKSSIQHVQRKTAMVFICDRSSMQQTESIIVIGDVLIYLPVYINNHIWRWYDMLCYSILGCMMLDGALYFHKNISECYQRCLHKQQSAFEYLSYKVTRLELFSLLKQ
jgi:hypothetical protein